MKSHLRRFREAEALPIPLIDLVGTRATVAIVRGSGGHGVLHELMTAVLAVLHDKLRA